jgi:hypothetical protein
MGSGRQSGRSLPPRRRHPVCDRKRDTPIVHSTARPPRLPCSISQKDSPGTAEQARMLCKGSRRRSSSVSSWSRLTISTGHRCRASLRLGGRRGAESSQRKPHCSSPRDGLACASLARCLYERYGQRDGERARRGPDSGVDRRALQRGAQHLRMTGRWNGADVLDRAARARTGTRAHLVVCRASSHRHDRRAFTTGAGRLSGSDPYQRACARAA